LRHRLVHWRIAVEKTQPPLPFPDNSFDLIYAVSVFTHLSEEHQRTWLPELRRVLRPGGRLLLVDIGGEQTSTHTPHARAAKSHGVHAVVGTGQHQVSFGFDDSTGTNTEYYFVELNQNDPMRDAAIVTYDATNGYVLRSTMDPGDLHGGSGYNRVDIAPANMSAVIGWTPSELYSLSTPGTGYTHTDKIRFSLRGLDVSIRYVAIITSG